MACVLCTRPHPFGRPSSAQGPSRQSPEQGVLRKFTAISLSLIRALLRAQGLRQPQGRESTAFGRQVSLVCWAFSSPSFEPRRHLRVRALRGAEHFGAGQEGELGPRGAHHPAGCSAVLCPAQLTWLACPGPWAASRALYSPSDISTRKPVTPSRGCAPWISGSAMIDP